MSITNNIKEADMQRMFCRERINLPDAVEYNYKASVLTIKICALLCLVGILQLLLVTPAHAWFDRTHLAIAKAAGYVRWYNAAGADQTLIKAGDIERYNHFFNNNDNAVVSSVLVLSQIKKYNDPNDTEGHLYGAVLHALRDHDAFQKPFYQMGYAVHYIGDLSQPMHNYQPVNDPMFRQRHRANDGIVDHEVLDNIDEIKRYMYFIGLSAEPADFEQSLAKEIARIANISRELSNTLKNENRNLTRDEAYRQLGHSASLIRALLNRYGF